MAISRGLADVQGRVDAALSRARRPQGAARLIAVSKTHPGSRVIEACQAGQLRFGENRVQEALAKQVEVEAASEVPVEWHLIGPLQRNKAKQVVGRFELLHGVDSVRLIDELNLRSAARALTQPLLLQVRLGGESTKSGVEPAALPALVDHLLRCEHLELRGLMTIPPPVAVGSDARRWFAELRQLAESERERTGAALPELSMGMSGDFEVAIEEGATLVRVGRAIFGERS